MPKISQVEGACDTLVIPNVKLSQKALTLDDQFLKFDLDYQILPNESNHWNSKMGETGQMLLENYRKFSDVKPLNSG